MEDGDDNELEDEPSTPAALDNEGNIDVDLVRRLEAELAGDVELAPGNVDPLEVLVAELDPEKEFLNTVDTCPLESVIVLVSTALACDDISD